MTIHVENLGGGIGEGKPPVVPPNAQARYVLDIMSGPDYEGPLAPYWSTAYIGSDPHNMGLHLRRSELTYRMHIDPAGENPDPGGKPFQSGIVIWPWPLAWYTQVRATSQTVIGIDDMDRSGVGSGSISCLGCFSGNLGSGGQCYALTASVDWTDPAFRIGLHLQLWTFPNVPNISGTTAPNTKLTIENLVNCGFVDIGDRLFLYTVDKGSSWDISGWVVPHFNDGNPWQWELRGYMKDRNDAGIQAGMGAYAFNTWSSVKTFTVIGALVVGWGPNDVPPTLP